MVTVRVRCVKSNSTRKTDVVRTDNLLQRNILLSNNIGSTVTVHVCIDLLIKPVHSLAEAMKGFQFFPFIVCL